MAMSRYLGFEQRHSFAATHLAEVVERQAGTLSRMHRRIALHVRKSEIALAVTAICGAEQRKERGVLAERQNLPVTKRPALGRKVEGKNSDLSNKRVGHDLFPFLVLLLGL